MGGGPSSEVRGNTVQLVWVPGPCCCHGLKELEGDVPEWLKDNYAQIVEMGEPYGSKVGCQMDCCGEPLCESIYGHARENVPLMEMISKFPQYRFSFKPEWCGMGHGAHWEHVLQISNVPGAVTRQVVGVPKQASMP